MLILHCFATNAVSRLPAIMCRRIILRIRSRDKTEGILMEEGLALRDLAAPVRWADQVPEVLAVPDRWVGREDRSR